MTSTHLKTHIPLYLGVGHQSISFADPSCPCSLLEKRNTQGNIQGEGAQCRHRWDCGQSPFVPKLVFKKTETAHVSSLEGTLSNKQWGQSLLWAVLKPPH